MTSELRLRVWMVEIAVMICGVSLIAAEPATRPALRPIKIVLVGDSTVTAEAGWGNGFVKMLHPEATCVNWAKGGRSSRSFIDEGWWEKARAEKPDYVLVQFGHNDQPGKGPQRETDPASTYPQFMSRYIDEARAMGATPILVTSLTRRRFGADGKIHSDLLAYVDAVKKLAIEKNVPLIDLHARSIGVLDAMGPTAAEEFDPSPAPTTAPSTQPVRPDKTHLTPKGADVFGRIVADELRKAVPDLTPYVN